MSDLQKRKAIDKRYKRERAHKRLRQRVVGTAERPRLAVFKSEKYVYAQVIDDDRGHTLVSATSLEPALKDSADPVVGGVYNPLDESGDAWRFTQELARIAESRGVRFRYGAEIEAVEAEGDSVAGIRLKDESVAAADAYVVSLGSYSPLLLAPLGIRIPVYPLKGYSITLPLGPAEQAARMKGLYGSITPEQFQMQNRMALASMITDPADVDRAARWAAKAQPSAVGSAIAEMMTTDLRQ